MSKQSAAASGHSLWSKMPKASAELFALTYGSLVTELIRDYEDVAEVNSQLDRIGHSIGIRCVDEFLAKAEVGGVHVPRCEGLRETADVVARIGFRMFLGVNAEVGNVSPDGSGFSLFLHDNPLSIFVELPSAEEGGLQARAGGCDLSKVKYSNIYCGVIRGALEQVNLKVDCNFVRDILRGDDANEIRVVLKEVLADGAGDDYQEE
jgi:hypothetical protein